MDKKPVIFKHAVKVRFSDVDRYQHVNTVYYPDYVYTSRFEFLEEKFGIAPDQFEKDGMGFYTARFESKFHKPIAASVSYVYVESKVKSMDRSMITVEFRITDKSEGVLYSTGEFDVYVIDLATQKPMRTMPASFEAVLFES